MEALIIILLLWGAFKLAKLALSQARKLDQNEKLIDNLLNYERKHKSSNSRDDREIKISKK
jgi:hypothetical protein